jgi:hypothetical protein
MFCAYSSRHLDIDKQKTKGFVGSGIWKEGTAGLALVRCVFYTIYIGFISGRYTSPKLYNNCVA